MTVPDKRRAILEAASRVFRRQGLAATGMRDIAREAGMTAGNLYHYFESKQALLAFCQRDALAGLLALAREAEAGDLATDATLKRWVVGHFVHLNEGVPGSLAHLEVESLQPPWRNEILAERASYERSLRALVRRGIDEGVFRSSIDPKTAALALLGALNWSVKWFRPEGGRSAREIGEEFADLLAGGLLAAPSASTRPGPPAQEIPPQELKCPTP